MCILYINDSRDNTWYYWKQYKSQQAAYDASKSLFSGEAWSPTNWFKKDLIKVVENGHSTLYSPKTFF